MSKINVYNVPQYMRKREMSFVLMTFQYARPEEKMTTSDIVAKLSKYDAKTGDSIIDKLGGK